MSLTSIYYVKQDNTIWGCGDPACCGEYYEEIDEDFVKCDCGIPEEEMTADHLQSCNGGGEVLEWRKADLLEMKAFYAGQEEGWQDGSDWGIEWQKNQADSEAMRLFKTVQEHTVHQLVHQGYKVTVDGSMLDKSVSVFYEEKLGGK